MSNITLFVLLIPQVRPQLETQTQKKATLEVHTVKRYFGIAKYSYCVS